MARGTIETSSSKKKSGSGGENLTAGKKRVVIAATTALVLSLGFVGWYIYTSDPGSQEIEATPLQTSLLSIANMTQSGATVKVKPIGEANAPSGFKGDGTPVKDPMQVDLEPQQGDQFVFSDPTALATDAPIEIEIEANVGGTPMKAVFTFPRKQRVYVNLYEAGGGPVIFEPGPGVTMK